MTSLRKTALATTAFLLLSGPAFAVDAHHPPAADATAAAPLSQAATDQPATPAQPGVTGSPCADTGMMGMMGPGMMGPGAMGMMGGGPAVGMPAATPGGMIDRIEGRIAFLQAELKIAEAQQAPWQEFADALRVQAKQHNDMRAATMQQTAQQGGASPALAARLEWQEQALDARLGAMKGLRAAYQKLHGLLTDEQKTTLDELLSGQMGLGI